MPLILNFLKFQTCEWPLMYEKEMILLFTSKQLPSAYCVTMALLLVPLWNTVWYLI